MLAQLFFAVCVAVGAGLFARRVAFIRKNILMGQAVDRSDRAADRWKVMARVALGQGKMVTRPVAGIMHILIYVGFVVINIELLEIVIDGLFGTHRAFAGLGGLYNVLIGTFEVLAALVVLACVVFFVRRNGMALARFKSPEMGGWPTLDANLILIAEVPKRSELWIIATEFSGKYRLGCSTTNSTSSSPCPPLRNSMRRTWPTL